MSSILKFLGGVFLAILILLSVLGAIYYPKGVALQKDAIAYIETNVPLIVANWDSTEITKRAAPEFLVPSVQEGLPVVFSQLSKLGKLKRLGVPKGGFVVANLQLAFAESRPLLSMNNQQLQPIWAEFIADADFEAGPAKVKMTLVRRGSEWRIFGFWVGPPTA